MNQRLYPLNPLACFLGFAETIAGYTQLLSCTVGILQCLFQSLELHHLVITFICNTKRPSVLCLLYSSEGGFPLLCKFYMCMLWVNFIFGLNFTSLCFKLIIVHYHTYKPGEMKFKPRIKLNHNMYARKFYTLK